MKWFKNIILGLKSFKKAHQAIVEYKLWGFIIFPGLINLLFFIGFLYFLYQQWFAYDFSFLEVSSCLELKDTSKFWCEFYNNSIPWLGNLFKFIIILVYLALYIFLYKYFILIIFSPFYSFLVAKIHQKEELKKGNLSADSDSFSWKQFIKDVVRGVRVAFKYGFFELVFTGLTFLLLLIPVVNIVQPFILLAISAYYFGVNMLDYSLEIHQINRENSYRISKGNKGICLALGTGYRLISLIPIYGWMFAPTYTIVAGYYCFNDLNRERLDV